jgi:ParB family transcriptional regulator, chromosome partitioning protein
MIMAAAINSLKSLNKGNEQMSKTDLFQVDPRIIQEEDGFNTRGAFCDDYYEQPEIAAGIRSLADAYKRGDFVPPIIVKVRDGQVFVREGHRRRRGMLLAIEEGAQLVKVPVIEHKGDESEQSLLICTSNDGLPLTPLERGVVYGRLNAWGWSDQEIANKVGRTAEHVRITRGYLELPIELKKMVQADQVAVTYAAELYKEHGESALDVLKKAISEQPQAGAKKKITKKKVQTGPRLGKKVVEQMHKSVSSIASRLDGLEEKGEGEYTLTLNKEEVDGLLALKEQLAAAEAKAAALGEENAADESQLVSA